MATVITSEFLERIRHDGALAQALGRLKTRGASYEPLVSLSTWELVCEEVLDTTYELEYYERVAAELLLRGLSESEITEMRVFAWKTAGWMNYDKMLWDWVSLSEFDLLYALDWMHRDGVISAAELEAMRAYVQKYIPAQQNGES